MKNGKRIGMLVGSGLKKGVSATYSASRGASRRIAESAAQRYERWQARRGEEKEYRRDIEAEAKRIYYKTLAREKARIRAEAAAARYAAAERRAIQKAGQPSVLSRIGKGMMRSFADIGRGEMEARSSQSASQRGFPQQKIRYRTPIGIMDYRNLLPKRRKQ